MPNARFVHVNLIAKDWRSLASFYQRVFDCSIVPPERDYTGPLLDAGTGIPGAKLRGAHLRLPGFDSNGPTLEIYQYEPAGDEPPHAVNSLGYGHIAFSVDDVAEARRNVLANGGTSVGELVTLSTADGRKVTWAYLRDPEGNIIELHSWSES
jgi:predicted enzyme related to lactoylglutathione lyase